MNNILARNNISEYSWLLKFSSFVGLLLLATAVVSLDDSGISRRSIVLLISFASFSIAMHLLFSVEKNWLRLDTMFLTSFVIVNFQWPVMYTIWDYVPQYSHVTESLITHGNQAVYLSTIALICWSLGFFLHDKIRNKKKLDYIAGSSVLTILLFILLGAFAAAAGTTFFTRSIYSDSFVFTDQTVGTSAAYLLDILETIVRLSLGFTLYQFVIFDTRKSLLQCFLEPKLLTLKFGLLVFCLIFLVGGERGQVLAVLLAVLLAHAKTVKPVSPLRFAFYVLIGVIVFSFLGIFRTGVSDFGDFFENYGFFALTQSLAQSATTLTQAIDMKHTGAELGYGQVWISQTLGVIPFLQSAVIDIFDWDIKFLNSALAITNYTFGSNAHTSLGTSIVADFYLAFDVPGVIVGSITLGYTTHRMSHWLSGNYGFFRFNVALIFAGLIFYLPRTSVLFLLKPIVWAALAAPLIILVRKMK